MYLQPLTEMEYFQLVCSESIVPTDKHVFAFIDNEKILDYWNSNNELPRALIEPILIEVMGISDISDTRKEELLTRLKYWQISEAAGSCKEPDLSFIQNTLKDDLRPLGDCIDEELSNLPITIPTGISDLDLALGGGTLEQSYNLILAETNIGKTTLMLQLALNYMKQNKKVVYITFEETKSAILSRLMQNILGIKMADVSKTNPYQRKQAAEILKNIVVIAKPSCDISTTDFFKMISTVEYEFCFIDYYIHFKKNPKNDHLLELTKISSDLSSFAKRNNKIIWSAAQARRESFGKKPSLADAGSSIDSVRLADVVITAHKGEVFCDDEQNKYNVKLNVVKDRQGANRTKEVDIVLDVHHQKIESEIEAPSAIIPPIRSDRRPTTIKKGIL